MTISEVLLLARENIRSLTPYSTARDEYRGELGILLDATESPYGKEGLNRYPSRNLRESLAEKISKLKGLPRERLFLGNGSDETIDLCYRVFCQPGKDNAVMIASASDRPPQRYIALAKQRRIFTGFPSPNAFATGIAHPEHIPSNNPMIRKLSDPVALMPAKALTPTKRPTMTLSAIL